MRKSKSLKQVILILVFAIISSFTLGNVGVSKGEFSLFFPENILLTFVLGILLYQFYSKVYFQKKFHFLFYLLAGTFSVFMVLGDSFQALNNWNLVFGSCFNFFLSCIKLIGYFVLFLAIITFVFDFIMKKDFIKENKVLKKVSRFFDAHPFWGSVIVLIICWLPYIIAFYPAILSPDPSNQIKQFFGLPTHYIEGVNLLDPSVVITNHHPFFHTILLGGCVKLGHMLGSDNLGLFFYSILQIAVFVSVLAYTICYMKKMSTPYWFRWITLFIYALVPVFPLYAMSAVKDVLFGSFVILYIIILFDIVKKRGISEYKNSQIVGILVVIMLMLLVRNNGIHVLILSFPFLFFVVKKYRLRLFIYFMIPVFLFMGYDKVLLPSLKITPGSSRELLSIPFQQTARYVKEYGDDITEEEKDIIDKVLGYDDLGERYKPDISDPVKNKFNKDTSGEDMSRYFRVWFQGFFKHPDVYFNATISNTYGYFYPNTRRWYIYYNYDSRLKDAGFDYQYNSLSGLRDVLSKYGEAYPTIPIVGVIVNIGFSVWILLALGIYLLRLKKYRYLIYLLPAYVLILVCFASPVNTYFRYALPYIFGLPLMVAMFLNVVKEEVDLNEKK